MMKPAPATTPWRLLPTSSETTLIVGALDQYVCEFNFDDHMRENQAHEDAARIVACVNACAGMEDPVAYIAQLKGTAQAYDNIMEDL